MIGRTRMNKNKTNGGIKTSQFPSQSPHNRVQKLEVHRSTHHSHSNSNPSNQHLPSDNLRMVSYSNPSDSGHHLDTTRLLSSTSANQINSVEISSDNTYTDGQTNRNLPNTALKLNIGGKSFRVRPATIRKRVNNESCPLKQLSTRTHANRLSICDEYMDSTDEYYFERSAVLFEPIFDWLISGQLHRPANICAIQFLTELDYWKIHSHEIASCCVPMSPLSPRGSIALAPTHHHYAQSNGGLSCPDINQNGANRKMSLSARRKSEFQNLKAPKLRYRIWQFTEDPSTSLGAKIFAFLSILFVVLSVAGLILGSMQDLQVQYEYEDSNGEHKNGTQPVPALQYMEFACIGWFTVEYVVRWLVAPDRLQFMKQPMNVIDLITVAPFYLELLMGLAGFGADKLSNFKGAVMIIRIVRVLRVTRIFKLARYSTGMKSFGLTVQNSIQELSMLVMFLVTAVIFFSTIVYFLEKDEEGTHFHSIPDACWWCIVTMTTVGYGDSVPITALGKVVASFASISGVLVLAFPITMIVENFSRNYENANTEVDDVSERDLNDAPLSIGPRRSPRASQGNVQEKYL